MTRQELRDRFGARPLQVLVVIVMVMAAVGLFTGTRQIPVKRGYAAVSSAGPAATEQAPRAVSYLGWRTTRLGPNADMYSGAFDPLEPKPALSAPVEQTPEDRDRAIEARKGRRAYEGAPPTIPHIVEASDTNSCLACHEKGAVIFGKTARLMSHREYPVCTQCHVAERSDVPSGPPLTANSFPGLPRYGSGVTAWAGAPPTIPHPTNMRTTCASCHGPLGPIGLRTTHPQRQSCTQCHAPSAELDWRSSSESPPPGTTTSPRAQSPEH